MNAIDFLFLEQAAVDYEAAIKLCAGLLEYRGYVKDTFAHACLDRENKFPTGVPVPGGVAIPHAEASHVHKSCLCLLRLLKPVKFHRIDDPAAMIDVNFVVCIAISESSNHSAVLAQLITAFQDADFVQRLKEGDGEEAFGTFRERMAEQAKV